MKDRISIVIADDDRDDQEFLIEAIEASQIKCDIASAFDGTQMMNMLSKLNATHKLPDLIILDLNMPLMDGFEVLKRVKDDEDLKHIPICIFTTSYYDRDKEKSISLGASGFYSKPMSLQTLKGIVKTIFEDHLHLTLS